MPISVGSPKRPGFPYVRWPLFDAIAIAIAVALLLPAAAISSRGRPTARRPHSTQAPVPSHIPTWAYDDGCNGGVGASGALVRAWVSFAESNCGSRARKALDNCRWRKVTYCIAVEYLDTNWIYADGGVPVARFAQESWWLHEPGYTDSAHRIAVASFGGGAILDQSNPEVEAWFRAYVRRHYNQYPALMMDNASASLAAELYYAGMASSDEVRTNRQLQIGHERMAAALTHRNGTPFLQVDNALNSNPSVASPFPMLNRPWSVFGMLAEGAPEDDGTMTKDYATLLDELAYVDATPDDSVVLLSYDPAGSLQSRRVQAATEWLGYDGGHVVSWSDLELDSRDLSIWPEEGIVPTSPIESMAAPGGRGCLAGEGVICSRGGHNGIQVAPDVYRREFADCYYRSTAIGQCAAVVNASSLPVTVRVSWLRLPYTHVITMAGGDVQSGGRVVLSGAPFLPGVTVIPAHDAILLSR